MGASSPLLDFTSDMGGQRLLLLHLGGHKTGTTALQVRLASRMEALRACGVSYPGSGMTYWQHRPLMEAALRDDSAGILAWLERARAEADGRHVILSSEWAQFLGEPQTAMLHAGLSSVFPDHRVICLLYVRRQDEMYDSFYNQEVKYGVVTDDFADFFARHQALGRYGEFCQRWASLVGADNIVVRLYDRQSMVDGNTVSDFCRITGLGCLDHADASGEENASLSSELFLFKRRINRFITLKSDSYLRALAAILSDVTKDAGGTTRVTTTRMERAFVMQQFAESNNGLFETYFAGRDVFNARPDTLSDCVAHEGLSGEVLASLFVHVTQYFEHIATPTREPPA